MSFWIRYKRSTPFPDIQPNTLGDFSPVFNLCFKAMRMELLASSSRLSLTITSKNVQFGSSIPSLQISNSNRYSSRRIEICCSFFLWVSILSLQYGDFYNAYTHLQTLFLFYIISYINDNFHLLIESQWIHLYSSFYGWFKCGFIWSHRRICRFFWHCKHYIWKDIL